jgi:hypothetical protein
MYGLGDAGRAEESKFHRDMIQTTGMPSAVRGVPVEHDAGEHANRRSPGRRQRPFDIISRKVGGTY